MQQDILAVITSEIVETIKIGRVEKQRTMIGGAMYSITNSIGQLLMKIICAPDVAGQFNGLNVVVKDKNLLQIPASRPQDAAPILEILKLKLDEQDKLERVRQQIIQDQQSSEMLEFLRSNRK